MTRGPRRSRPYRGIAMEGVLATWYDRITGRDLTRFTRMADALAPRLAPGARVLEVAPGPGYLAIELARRGFAVTGVDLSRSFLRLAEAHARTAGVRLELRHGDAAHLPLADSTFDAAVCSAAFKNFTAPVGALDELHRVLRPGGVASVFDLDREAPVSAVEDEVRRMGLSRRDAFITRLTFRHLLLRRAYTREAVLALARESRFRGGVVDRQGVGFELRLVKPTP